MTNGEKTRVRDKNKVKLVKQLPVQKSCTSQPRRCQTTGEELDIDLRNVPSTTTQLHAPQSPSHADEDNRMNERPQQLLQAPENSAVAADYKTSNLDVPEEQRLTSSSGKTFSWNRQMNSCEALLDETYLTNF